MKEEEEEINESWVEPIGVRRVSSPRGATRRLTIDWVPSKRKGKTPWRKKVSEKTRLSRSIVKKPKVVEELPKEFQEIELLSNEERRQELVALADLLEKRKKYYGIVDTVLGITKQQEVIELLKRVEDRYKWYLYYGWNGSGKTFLWAYVTVCLALGRDTRHYNLPYLGEKKNIWVVTKSWSNIQSTIDPYLLWEFSKTRIPPEMIDGNPHRDNKILKWVKLKNGCQIKIMTYDQEGEGLQWGNPDFVWLDEEPRKHDVWMELFARTRVKGSEMLITMTPLAWKTPVYEFFFNEEASEIDTAKVVIKVSAKENPYTDHRLFSWYSNEEYLRRVEGSFAPPSWLVYSEFNPSVHVIRHLDPTNNNFPDTEFKYYRSIDFGTSHPMAAIFAAVDWDDNIYIFDEIYMKNTLLSDFAEIFHEKSKWYDFEYTTRDTAGAREWLELQALWIRTIRANKHSRGLDGNDMSNRRAWIMKVNNLLFKRKIFVSDRCKNIISEFSNHFYKEGGKRDGEVEKVNDDALDALRYLIFSYSSPKSKTYKESKYIKKYKESHRKEIIEAYKSNL